LAVPCRVIFIPPGKIAETAKQRGTGIEGAARLYRHAAWNRERRRIRAERVLVAHTRDDLLETTLMRFLRGSGPAGLAAMPRKKGRILRPLLGLSRSQVLDYLAMRGIPYRTDSTNTDIAFLRNRIRNRLIPQLDELFPHWRPAALGLAETQRRTADFLAAEAAARIPWEAVGGAVELAGGGFLESSRRLPPVAELTVSRERFFAAPEIVREEAVFLGIDRLNAGRRRGDGPDQTVSGTPRRGSLRAFTRGGAGGPRAVDLGAARIAVRGDRVILTAGGHAGGEKGFSRLIKEPGPYKIKGIIVEVVPSAGEKKAGGTGFFAGIPLVLRQFYGDDRIMGKALEGSRRSGYTDMITAEDARGAAAFIGINPAGAAVLMRREAQAGIPSVFVRILTGGFDVKRAEQ
jgi:tRNA(Ile)-lysidine synthase